MHANPRTPTTTLGRTRQAGSGQMSRTHAPSAVNVRTPECGCRHRHGHHDPFTAACTRCDCRRFTPAEEAR